MSTHKTIEDLLLETLDAVSRFRVGQREAVTAALDAGLLLVGSEGPPAAWRLGGVVGARGAEGAHGDHLDAAVQDGTDGRGRDNGGRHQQGGQWGETGFRSRFQKRPASRLRRSRSRRASGEEGPTTMR